MVDISNIKQVAQRADTINQTVDVNLEKIHRKYTEKGFTEVSSNGFNQTNTIKDLSQNIKFGYSESTIKDIGTDADGHALQSTFPISGAYLKPGVSVADNVNPKTVVSSSGESNTIHTDRKDKNLNIKRWVTRSIFKFREEDYGYDRQVYEIPVKFLMEGVMGDANRHSTTLAQYPYPEEIIMFSQKNKKHFIHFVNVQYSDSHYNYYAAKPYNLMIVKDRVNYGVKNNEGDTKFATYTSVYANNINDSLAFYKEGYVSFPMPDISFGDELLDTLWDCKVIWRADAPNRELTIQYNVENRTEDINIEDKDNIAWKETSNGLSNIRWQSICYGNGKYVAIALNSNKFAYSTDGINWTETSNGLTSREPWNAICYGNDKFVAVTILPGGGGEDHFTSSVYSTDGINWTMNAYELPDRNWRSICYGNGAYIAVSDFNTVGYSFDGINWKEIGIGLISESWYSICYGKDKYVVATNSNTFAYSSDGITWGETSNGLNTRNWRSICYGNDKYVAVAYNSNTFAYSTDGINWTETSNGLNSRNWQFICYGNDKYVAVASNSNKFAYSSDGINWTEISNGINDRRWYSICYGNGKFVAIADNSNTFAYSVIEKTITSIDLSTTQNLNTISGRSLLSTIDNTIQSNKIDSIKDEYLLLSIPYSPNIINHSIYSYYDDTTSTKDFKLSKIPSYSESTTILSSTVDMKSTLPNMIIPIDNEYLLGIKYLNISSSNKYYTRSTSLSLGVFKHDLVAVSTATSNANYPCDTIISEISGSDYILKVIPLYHTKTLVDGSPQLKFVVYTQTKKYLVIITSTSGVLSYTASTLTSYGDILNNVERVNKTQCILFGSSNKIYVDTIEENSYSENPFGITESPVMYLIGRYNLVKIMSNKTVSALGDYSNQSGFNNITNGTSEIALSSMKNNRQGDKLINERFAIMSDSSKSYLTHLRENYSFNIELDEGPTVTQKFEWIKASNPSTDNILYICYGHNGFVAITDKMTLLFSNDGITWAQDSDLEALPFERVVGLKYGNQKYVIVGYNISSRASIMYSDDGHIWNLCELGSPIIPIQSIKPASLFYGNDVFIIMGETRGDVAREHYYILSSDGINWNYYLSDNLNSESTYDLLAYNSTKKELFAYYRYNSNGVYDDIAISNDGGLTWNMQTPNFAGSFSDVMLNNTSLACSNSTYFMNIYNFVLYSDDGIEWNKAEIVMHDSISSVKALYGNGLSIFVGIANSNIETIYSYNSKTWINANNNIINFNSISDGCYGKDKFVIVGNNGEIAYSYGLQIVIE